VRSDPPLRRARVFTELGYRVIGEYLHLGQHIQQRRIDVLLHSVTGRPICVLEKGS
jgi:hypothetical protein